MEMCFSENGVVDSTPGVFLGICGGRQEGYLDHVCISFMVTLAITNPTALILGIFYNMC